MGADGDQLQEEHRGEIVTVVAIDRREEDDVVLRFLINEVSWDVHAREVRLTKDLAEQLMEMLVEELEVPARVMPRLLPTRALL
jgi:hypothetical protein